MVSIIVDEQVQLRSYQPEDAPELFRTIEASRQHLRPWLNWIDKHTRLEHTQHFIQYTINQLNQQDGLYVGIFKEKEVVGELCMYDWKRDVKKAQVGYWIGVQHSGKGLLHQCLIRFMDFLFEKTGLNKIEIHFVQANQRSARVAEKLGCKTEGILRQSYLRNGLLDDLIVTGILKQEWRKQQNQQPNF